MKNNFKQIFIVLTCTFYTLYANAQQIPRGNFDEWGKITKEELQLKECSFEKNADAMMLLDLGQVFFSKNNPTFYAGNRFRITSAYYRRYKVFSEKGIRKADFKHKVKIQIGEDLKNIKAVCYNLVNGEIVKTELKATDIHSTKSDEYHNEVTFSVPGVKPGSVFEVGYEREQTLAYSLPMWFFTSDIPCLKSSLTVGFLDPLIYYVHKYVMEGALTETSTPFKTYIDIPSGEFISREISGKAITYTVSNLHSFEAEPNTNSIRNYTSWIGFQLNALAPPLNDRLELVNNFQVFAKHTLNDVTFKSSATGAGIPSKYWSGLIKDQMTDEEKAKAIFNFIRENMKWNGYSATGTNRTNASVWKDKTGSNTEINLLLLNTLRQANLTAYPVVVSNRHKGFVIKSYPMMEQYTGIDVMLELDKNRKILLDASEKYLPFGLPAYDQLGTSALVLVDEDSTYWYNVKDRTGTREHVSIKGEMDEAGLIKGEVEMVYNTYTAQDIIDDKISGNGGTWSEMLKEEMPSATIESSHDSLELANCRFSAKVKFTAQAMVDNDGNIYLSVPTVYGRTSSPYVNAERGSDLDFGCKSRTDVVMDIKLPDNYVVDSIVPNIRLNMQDSSMTFVYNAESQNGTVSIRQKIDRVTSFYPVDAYSGFYEFFRKYYTLKQNPVIIKKKK